MLMHPVDLIDGVTETLAALAGTHRLWLVTKGDLRDQERKLEKSGLAEHFERIEIVSEKNETTYGAIFRRHAVSPENFLMVGNSLKSDILPVLALGGAGAYVPYHIIWAAERVEDVPAARSRFFQLKTVRELPGVIATLLAAE
jgi:putative hydrolase of the HAD superfamily